MPPSLLEILQKTADFFSRAGIERPRVEAEWLLAGALGCQRLELYLHFERPMEPSELDRLRPLVARRARREPLQFILGQVEFCGLDLAVDRRALIPRPETEALVEHLKGGGAGERSAPPGAILDLGTGSGAIALALAQAFPGARVVAVDQSAEALALAASNAARTGLEDRVEFREGSWFEPVAGERFDLVVSNPPYLSEAEWREAQPEVRDHEPKAALVAGAGGLADLCEILARAPGHLSDSGCIALETGIAHHAALAEAARENGYARWEGRPDDSGRERCFFAWR